MQSAHGGPNSDGLRLGTRRVCWLTGRASAGSDGVGQLVCGCTTGAPITEREALGQVAAMGLHGLAFDDVLEQDEVWTHPINKDPADRPRALST